MKTKYFLLVVLACALCMSCRNTPKNNNNAAPGPGADTTAATPPAPTDPAPVIDPNSINGHKFVDLGNGIKWAVTNIGANAPEEYGDYFAWGEVAPKAEYSWDNYAHRDKDTKSEYMIPESFVNFDKPELSQEFDAARQLWGGSWRMPTDSEFRQLRHDTTREWVQQNDVWGYLLTSKINGEKLFLPAAGYKEGKKTNYTGDHGYYWSTTFFDGMSGEAYHLYFKYTKSSQRFEPGFYSACCGFPIRPVSD